MAVGNAINEQTTGICGFTGTAFTGTAVTNHAVIIGGSTSSTLSNVGPTATAGQVLQSAGASANPSFSTPTYPSTSGSVGKILRSDGTNNLYTTATYPDTAGTSGNVLTSDGTNWISSPSSSAGFINGYLTSFPTNPSDSTTYYFNLMDNFTANVSSSAASCRFYATQNFTLQTVRGTILVGGTLASAQNCTFFIRVNDTSNTNLTTTLQLTSASNTLTFTSIGLALSAGDFFSFGFTGPAWTTNPTLVAISLSWAS